MKRALITGITGQDGSYLAEFLLQKGYEVHGLKRRSSSFNTDRVDHLYEDPHSSPARFFLHYADLTDGGSLASILYDIRPDEIYNLGAQSHVKVSFEVPQYTGDAVGMGTLRLLEAIHRTGLNSRFYQASSSEMVGSSPQPQSENTVFHPRRPLCLRQALRPLPNSQLPRELWPPRLRWHSLQPESPRRGETFVTRKITRAVAQFKPGAQDKPRLSSWTVT
jgi:GDPmannose 4,6-dehydratase